MQNFICLQLHGILDGLLLKVISNSEYTPLLEMPREPLKVKEVSLSGRDLKRNPPFVVLLRTIFGFASKTQLG